MENMNGLQKAHYDERSIRVEKLSPNTDTGGVCVDVLKFLNEPTNRWEAGFKWKLIGNNVWRAKVGKHGKWAYGRNIEEALEAAFMVDSNK